MSSERFEVAFDGPALANHKMDVRDLAPALLGLGDAIRRTNEHLNGGKATVSVYVESGFEHGSFQINFELWQELSERVGSLLADDDVRTAKDVLEWLGLLMPPGIFGVIWFLRKRRGRKILDVQDSDEAGEISVRIEGEAAPVIINKQVYQLGTSPQIVRPVSKMVSALDRPGIDEMTVRSKSETGQTITKNDARDIIESCKAVEDQPEDVQNNIVTAHLIVHSPTFDPQAEKWRFLYGGEAISADISDTNIARDVMERGTIGVNDTYKVRMEINERRTPGGQYRHDYKVLEVLDFFPSARQTDLFPPDGAPSASPDNDGS